MGRTGQYCTGRPRKEPAPPPPVLVGVNTQSRNPDLPDKTEETHSETPKETADTNDSDNVPMSETPLNDGRDASHIKSKSPVYTADGVRQRLKFDGEASGMTPDPRGETRESNALPGELPERKKGRFLSDSGDGGAAVVTVEELVEGYWSGEHGQELPKHVPLMQARTSTLKTKQIMIDLGNPLSAVEPITSRFTKPTKNFKKKKKQ